LVFFFQGWRRTKIAERNLLPVPTARAILKEFFETGARPNHVTREAFCRLFNTEETLGSLPRHGSSKHHESLACNSPQQPAVCVCVPPSRFTLEIGGCAPHGTQVKLVAPAGERAGFECIGGDDDAQKCRNRRRLFRKACGV